MRETASVNASVVSKVHNTEQQVNRRQQTSPYFPSAQFHAVVYDKELKRRDAPW